MEKLEFKITIDAPRERVWDILWGEKNYPQWTSVFIEDSSIKTDWKKGSKVIFLGGGNEGLISTIAEIIPNEYISFRHMGYIKDGVENFTGDVVKEWAGKAFENYTLKKLNGKTELTVDQDMTESDKKYFVDTWPKAMEKIKEMSEK